MPGPADPNDPTKLIDQLGEGVRDFERIATNAFQTLLGELDKSGNAVEDLERGFENLGDRIRDNSQSFSAMMSSADFKSLQDPLDKLVVSMMKLGQFTNQSQVFKTLASESATPLNEMTSHLTNIKQVMDTFKIPPAFAAGAMNLLNNANEAEKLETNFVALSAAGGDLNKVFDAQSGELKDLQALTAAYTTSVSDSAEATKFSIAQTMKMADALKIIPGAMDELITSGDGGIDTTTSLTAAMTLMSGTGRGQKDVIDAMTTAYEKLSNAQGSSNDAAQKGAELLATISTVSTSLNLRFEDVRRVMDDVADGFKFIGNETDATARTLGRYTDALRETGLTGKASMDIVQGMVKNISDLTVGTKAFLSLRSGGPGGLQGAFQIDQLLRQGKLDQVVQMAERSLRQQFGGRVYTQAEAAQSPEAASQFMRQRQLLQSGAFGIGAGMKDDQATRLLEALGKGDTLAATKEIKTGQDALTAVSKQGAQLQDRTNNYLKDANRIAERSALSLQIMAGATIRDTIGVGATTRGQRDLGRVADTNRGVEQQQQRLALERGGALDPAQAAKQLLTLGEGAIGAGIGSIKGLLEGGMKAIAGVKEETMETIRAGSQLMSEIRANSTEAQSKTDVLARTLRIPVPTPTAPAHLNVQQAAQHGPGPVPGGAAAQTGPLTIRLEINHPDGMTIKKVDTGSSVQNHNVSVINFEHR